MTAPGTITFTGHPPFHFSFDQSLQEDIKCSDDDYILCLLFSLHSQLSQQYRTLISVLWSGLVSWVGT